MILIFLFLFLYHYLNRAFASKNKFSIEDNFEDEDIFISIASYRDKECSLTVQSIYKNAKNPNNIYIGICEQNNSDIVEENCVLNDFKYKKNISYHNMKYLDAKGPAYARYFCSKLWSGQKYYLQIDSHTYFEKNWDVNLIRMLKQVSYSTRPETDYEYGPNGSFKPVLTVYPPSKEQLYTKGFPEMDNGAVTENGIIMFYAGITKKESKRPLRSPKPFYAAGFMFTYSSFLKDVPFDENLAYLFQGEELLFSSRMFTHGYDTFSPNIKVCYHNYNRTLNNSNLFWNEIPNYNKYKKISEQKVINLYQNDPMLFPKNYFGSERSLDDFWKASGITFKKDSSSVEDIIDIKKTTSSDSKSDGWNFSIDGYKKIKKLLP